jgi:hypothetical protein
LFPQGGLLKGWRSRAVDQGVFAKWVPHGGFPQECHVKGWPKWCPPIGCPRKGVPLWGFPEWGPRKMVPLWVHQWGPRGCPLRVVQRRGSSEVVPPKVSTGGYPPRGVHRGWSTERAPKWGFPRRVVVLVVAQEGSPKAFAPRGGRQGFSRKWCPQGWSSESSPKCKLLSVLRGFVHSILRRKRHSSDRELRLLI